MSGALQCSWVVLVTAGTLEDTSAYHPKPVQVLSNRENSHGTDVAAAVTAVCFFGIVTTALLSTTLLASHHTSLLVTTSSR